MRWIYHNLINLLRLRIPCQIYLITLSDTFKKRSFGYLNTYSEIPFHWNYHSKYHTCKYFQAFPSRCTVKMNGFCPKRRKGFKIRFCVGNCTECKTYCNKCWCICIITPQEKFRGTIHTTHTLSFDINLAQRENNFSVLKYKYYILT